MLRATLNFANGALRNVLRTDAITNKCLNFTKNVPIFNLSPKPSLITRNFITVNLNTHKPFLLPPQECHTDNVRTVTKFSLQSGKRKSVKAVLKRFYRLDWGMWIRGKCGRNKKLYKKSFNRKRRLQQHVFTNATQSWLLEKMVTKYWRKPKYYVDDPYQPYHVREEFPFTRKKPARPI